MKDVIGILVGVFSSVTWSWQEMLALWVAILIVNLFWYWYSERNFKTSVPIITRDSTYGGVTWVPSRWVYKIRAVLFVVFVLVTVWLGSSLLKNV